MYLGLGPDVRQFALNEIPVELLVVELCNRLCLTCVDKIPEYNRLFLTLESDPELRGRVKMLGLGVRSSSREVAKFRRREKIIFPVFADPDHEVFNCLGQPELPVIYLLRRTDDGLVILHIHQGHTQNLSGLLDRIRKAARH